MAKVKSTTLYAHPFCKDYWRDAAAELKDTKMLVFAALIVALRVGLKTIIRIPIAPNLDITPAFLANALGAMVYGPVVGAIGALVSDVLGVILRGDTYFPPYALTEIAGSMIFAMFFYRQKVTTTRVIFSRFAICLLVNILLQTPIDLMFYRLVIHSKAAVITLPRIFKNLCMFPIESVVLAVFLSAIQPYTYRAKMTYVPAEKITFSGRQIVLLVLLTVIGVGAVFAYLPIHYRTNSLTSNYTVEERIEANKALQSHVLAENESAEATSVVTIAESAYRQYPDKAILYTVAVYEVDEGVEITDDLWKLSKSKAADSELLNFVERVEITVDPETGAMLEYRVVE